MAQAPAIFAGDAVGVTLEQRDDAVNGEAERPQHNHHVPEARAAFARVLALYLPQRVGGDGGFVGGPPRAVGLPPAAGSVARRRETLPGSPRPVGAFGGAGT